ncbi:hypothetical protein Tco_1361886 [Tanacetum coccineum]
MNIRLQNAVRMTCFYRVTLGLLPETLPKAQVSYPNLSSKSITHARSLSLRFRWFSHSKPSLTCDGKGTDIINNSKKKSKKTGNKAREMEEQQRSKDSKPKAEKTSSSIPHHGFSELHQLDTFYNSLNTNDQDALYSVAGGNFLDKMPRDGLAIIKSKSKVRYSRSHAIEPRASTNAPLSTSTPSNSFEFQQLAASLEDKMDIRMSQKK